ncbi:hypothetical protein [Streptomyces jumonjinensis]|uniref:hypothetical protein n=1 Tax=Streptomyces jumonjinensis TaxID=1945 RepID=UPI0037BAF399
MAIDISGKTADDEIIDAEIVGEDEHQEQESAGRTARLKEAAEARRTAAVAALADQRVRVRCRLTDWFTTADLSDALLAEEVEARRRQALARQEAEVRLRIAALAARMQAAGDDPAVVGGLARQMAAAEVRLGALAGGTDADRRKIDLGKARWQKKATRLGAVAGGAVVYLHAVAAMPELTLAGLAAAPVGWWYLARPEDTGTAPASVAPVPSGTGPKVSLVKQPPVSGPYSTAPAAPLFDAPPPPALDEAVLTQALRDCGAIGRDATVTVRSAPAWGDDGTATTVFDLPPGITVAMLQRRQDAFAGALGRDVSMIDLTKAGAAGRCSLWMTDTDPFTAPRPSPLMTHRGGIDAWRDGVPVAWAKRGNSVALPVKNSNFLIAGMTRSGKGVGAANLAAGAALDVRVNLRIVAGKTNGEWDSYAAAGVAATYFKPSPARLLELLLALRADMDRRNRVLGELGKSKLTPESIARLGGIELLVVDELATYTRPGKPLRDELLDGLIELSAVAAGAGVLLVLITQYPEVDVIPQALAMNCGTRWAMRVDNAAQSNAVLGGGMSGSGRDASKFDPPLPGLGWLVNPFAGVTDLARSFDLDEDERGEVTQLMARAADLRHAAGRLTGQWDDPIETHLLQATGLSSAAGGPDRNGTPGRTLAGMSPEQTAARDALIDAIDAIDMFGRDAAQLDEMADRIGDGMTGDRLGELLRAAGAGPTVKVTIAGRGRVNGYTRRALASLLEHIDGA